MNKKVLSLLLSLIVTFFMIINYDSSSLLSLLIGIVSFIVFNYSLNKSKKKYIKLSLILSIILSIIFIICKSIEKTYTIDIFNRYLLINFFGYLIIFYFSIVNLFDFTDKYKKNIKEDRHIYIGNKEILTTSKFSFIVNFSIIFIIELLFLLKFYPSNMTYDSFNELEQIKGILPLMNNHSILHTGILALFVKLGMLFKSMNLGIFLYSLFQITLVSLTFSYILYFLSKEKVPLLFRIISLLFFMVHPINVVYSFTLWKDILFSMSFALFVIFIYYLSNDKDYFKSKKNIILFSLLSLLVMYFRNNGVYVVIISFIILYIYLRKKNTKILQIFLGIILTFFISKILIFNALNIKGTSVREILSIPSQAISRIYKLDYNKLTKKEKISIEKFYSDEIGDVYNPIIADNTKGLLNEKYLLKHKGEYAKLNIELFFKYNKKYVESFISNSYGYYFIETNYPSLIIQKTDLYNVKHKEIIGNFTLYLILVFISTLIMLLILWNLNEKKNILLLGLLLPVFLSLTKDNSFVIMLMNIGIYVYITFFTYVYNKKNKNNVLYYIPIIILWISILFSPVYNEFRYLYPLFILTLVFVSLTFKEKNK